ncbi:MAG: hypothetical protein JNK05_12825 [Myxococcales bacterium]|nr:hypothetical protein [Myxococcales bacterium]
MPVGAAISLTVYGSASRSGPRASLDVDPAETLGAVFRRVAAALEIEVEAAYTMKTPYTISTEDGAWYTDGPDRWSTTFGQIAHAANKSNTGTALELFVYPLRVCMHGSPGILGRGHLCGWC